MINAAVAGVGVLLAPTYSVLRELERGDLVALLPGPSGRWRTGSALPEEAQIGAAQASHAHRYLRGLSPAEFGSW